MGNIGIPFCWGYNDAGQLGDGTNNDSNKSVQVLQTTGLTNVAAIAGGGYHSLAISSLPQASRGISLFFS